MFGGAPVVNRQEVPDTQVAEALAVLKESFKLSEETLADFGDRLSAFTLGDAALDGGAAPLLQRSPATMRRESAEVSALLPRHPLSFHTERLQLCSVRKEHADIVGTALLRLIFFPRSGRRFFSYSETDYELSIVLDEEDRATLPQDFVRSSSDRWQLIKVGDGDLGFSESGIVCSLATPLALAGISMFYVSTFSHDFVMVQQERFENTIKTLEAAKFDCRVAKS
eukprot:TRINITY_DN385_c0_g1_i1.p1 TRINITY_DN385_c0_g1~~TRINITY_DN385_c0_g1_i1.p1  ORF type:complete len:225 (-),score=64.89 TRINITY_DN385_c0_g1_i1:314-988(-)